MTAENEFDQRSTTDGSKLCLTPLRFQFRPNRKG